MKLVRVAKLPPGMEKLGKPYEAAGRWWQTWGDDENTYEVSEQGDVFHLEDE